MTWLIHPFQFAPLKSGLATLATHLVLQQARAALLTRQIHLALFMDGKLDAGAFEHMSSARRWVGKIHFGAVRAPAHTDPASGELDRIVDPEAGGAVNILNDGRCDRRGRFWVGSMSKTMERATKTGTS